MNEHKKIQLKDYRPFEFIVDHVDLIFDIRDDHTRVTSKLKMRKDPARANETTPLVLNKGTFDIVSVVAGDMVLLPSEYKSDDETFSLLATPDLFELEITNILKPDENTALEGLYRSGNILCTQCEAQGFRNITPYPDRPDVMAPFSCTIVADKARYPVLLSNGNLVKSGDLDNNRHFAVWEDPFKKPCYLFALVAGDLAVLKDQFTTASGRDVALNIYSEKEDIALCSHAMTSLKQAMAWDEKRFGREYDLDLYQIVAINDFNAGAMENKGLNIFNAKYVLADPQTATDDDFMGIQGVIAHEYFHNWTGNRVTLKNWFQLSLKEGLTVFRDQEFSSDMNSRPVKRIRVVKNLMAAQFPEDSGPMTHPVRPDSYIKMDNFYTMTVYEKGAEVIRMIYQLLGQDLFRKGMDLYFEKFDGMAVTLEDFVGVMAKVSGRNLDQFFLWYTQSGTPAVSMTRQYDENTEILSLTFTQTTSPDRNQSEKKPFHIPVRISLINRAGETVKQDALYELTKETDTFKFDNVPADTYPSVFREFTAPVRLTTDFSDQDLAFLMARDTDPFNQWHAAQTLFVNEIKNLVTAIQANKPMTVSSGLVKAFSLALENREKDRAFLSKALTLPLETEIKNHFKIIDVEAIHQARTFLKQTLAKKLASELKTVYEICRSANPDDISGAAMADRSLKNLCLSYLGCLVNKDIQDLVQKQFETAGNMTDEFAAFKILSHMNPDVRDEACHAFYDKWQTRTLVIDKWFSVQAQSSLEDTLDQVKKLTAHKDFTMANPNKVRALIFAFAMNNPMHFHRADGRGYEFVAERILALDKINHQTAARLCSCFNLWKRYDGNRQVMMKKQLETMAGQKELSRNLYEIVSRALE
ncbi:aminopeptidase N [Desulfobacter hydrogenophilus]|uniref:Aminopeptidase N n=1 Tax=Desulfobacter hydrogenophilus TaxID=2291 RepID=A0A328FCN8_9BACT|nr:aminopeptidase N [Desulfobacter hydrogenophilus]NDY72055.1 aminopeptidase N [Desulfobacter hydrogenophilus]QBH11477.1 aminopeptidase N [Desulfobacter hydrogenophilus]RAM01976.1 aminopeptidase N [Desulfobacter hydrogenophilus]